MLKERYSVDILAKVYRKIPLKMINFAISKIDCILKTVKQNESQITESLVGELQYTTEDSKELVYAIYRFLSNFPQMVTKTAQLFHSEQQKNKANGFHSRIQLNYIGKILVVIPSNAPSPLALILPIALIASGNTVVVVSNKKARNTSKLLFDQLPNEFKEKCTWSNESVRSTIAYCLETEGIDCLYYIGSSEYYMDIAAKCARNGVTLIYEGEGRGVTIFDSQISERKLKKAVDHILQALCFCNGQMCSKPALNLVPANIQEKFLQIFNERVNEYTCLSLEELLSEASYKDICAKLNLRKIQQLSPNIEQTKQPKLFRTYDPKFAIDREYFGPVSFVYFYNGEQEALNIVNKNKYKLQISIYSNNQNFIDSIIDRTNVARYCINMNPVFQDPIVPWGNYGLSGNSVVETFFDKGLRKCILEEGSP